MHFFGAASHRESLSPVGINQIDLVHAFVFFSGLVFRIIGIRRIFFRFSIREEGDPFAIGRPLRIGVVAGLR